MSKGSLFRLFKFIHGQKNVIDLGFILFFVVCYASNVLLVYSETIVLND